MASAKCIYILFIYLLLLKASYFCINAQMGLVGGSYVEKQLLCALDRAPCDAVGHQVKIALPEIIGNNCRSCDQKQIVQARRIVYFVQNKYPEVWNALVQKYNGNVKKN